jgi:hypothetical protein
LVSLPLAAQDSTLTRLIRQHSYTFAPTAGQFAGPGWDQLQQSIRRSQFVLLGEDHGLAEIPGFAAAVAQVLEPKAFVAEVSSFEARDLNQLAARPGLPSAFHQAYPFSLSFYSWTEEFQLVQALHARQVPVLGIDQVYAGSAGRLLAQMADGARNKRVQDALRARSAAFVAHDRRNIYEPANTGTSAMTTLTPAAVDSVVALTAAERPAVQRMAQAFAASYAIYQAAGRRTPLPNGVSAHQTRVNLMKRNLLAELQPYRQGPAQQLPKLLFKFGTNHVGRGLAVSSRIPDIGSLMANLADAQDHTSLHVMVMGKQGTQNVRDSFDHARNLGPLTPADSPFLKPFFEQTDTAWNLTDLRPARHALVSHKLRVEDPELERAILSYDYLVVIPQVTAAGNF